MNLSLLYPVKPLHINQIFGNPDPKYFALGLKGHNGIDFMASRGQPVYASHDGAAMYQTDTYGGHGVVIRSGFDFTYATGTELLKCQYLSIYWHFIGYPIITENQQVKAGDCIGFADSTGFSTGDHLHFGLKPIGEDGTNLAQENGFLGAIDPKNYFNGQYAQDVPRSAAEQLRVLGHQYIALGNVKIGRIILAVSKIVSAFV